MISARDDFRISAVIDVDNFKISAGNDSLRLYAVDGFRISAVVDAVLVSFSFWQDLHVLLISSLSHQFHFISFPLNISQSLFHNV